MFHEKPGNKKHRSLQRPWWSDWIGWNLVIIAIEICQSFHRIFGRGFGDPNFGAKNWPQKVLAIIYPTFFFGSPRFYRTYKYWKVIQVTSNYFLSWDPWNPQNGMILAKSFQNGDFCQPKLQFLNGETSFDQRLGSRVRFPSGSGNRWVVGIILTPKRRQGLYLVYKWKKTANWVIICYLPPITRTWNICWFFLLSYVGLDKTVLAPCLQTPSWK